jgi:hypothetical protein
VALAVRDKLREYYANQAGDPVVIALPKGSYVPTFDRAAETAFAPDVQFQAVESTSVDFDWRRGVLALGVALLFAGGYAAISLSGPSSTAPPRRIFETLRADRRVPALLNRLGLPLTAQSTRLARTTAF